MAWRRTGPWVRFAVRGSRHRPRGCRRAPPTSLALRALFVTRRATRWRDRIRAARADRLSGRPAALCRLRLRPRGGRDPLRAMRRGARRGAHGDRRRSRRRGPGGLGRTVRRRRSACGPRAQVRTPTVSCRRRREGHARRPPGGGVAEGCRTGARRAVAMALAGLRPGRGDRDLALPSGQDFRSGPACAAADGRRQVGRRRSQRLADPPHVWAVEASPHAALLVDDVWTTGATLSACALALRDGGCRRIVALTLARAL